MPIPGIEHFWIIGLLVIVLIIFGPGKLPQLGGAVGKAIREFRKAGEEIKDEVTRSHEAEPPSTATTASQAPAPEPTPVPPAAPTHPDHPPQS
ncbi:MAG: Sec-independent protein translocase subunit TatA/TatB [Candidatus Dormibacteraceae bacterium]